MSVGASEGMKDIHLEEEVHAEYKADSEERNSSHTKTVAGTVIGICFKTTASLHSTSKKLL